MIERATMGCKVPPMSLQLLVENAIKHGVGKTKNGGDIMIQARMSEKVLMIRVTNAGTLSLENKRIGVGMKNLQRRLSINFQEKAPKNINFLITKGLGHNKVYKTQAVIDKIMAFLAPED